MDPARMAATLAHLSREEVPDVLRALDLFVRIGMMPADEADAWRVAVRARAAELSEPLAEA